MFLEAMVLRLSFVTLGVQIIYYFLWRAGYGHRAVFRRGRFLYLGLVVFTQGHLWYYVFSGRDLWPYSTQGIAFFAYFLSMAWLLTLLCLVPFAVWAGVSLVGRRFRERHDRAEESISNHGENSDGSEDGISRSDFLLRAVRGAVEYAPAIGMVGISSGLFLGSREIVVSRPALAIPNVHEDLKGLRIVQISDIHVGSLVDEKYLRYCAGILAGLRADLLVVTGDIIDLSNHHAPGAGRFFRLLEKSFPLGILGVMGNHDFFDNGAAFHRIMRGGALRILNNQEIVLRRGRGRLRVTGLEYPWPHRGLGGARARKAAEYFNNAVRGAPPGFGSDGAPRIVLNHHPADFAWLRNEKTDLILSGHTHGGQVALTDRRESLLSPVSLFSTYYDGIYRERGSTLYVNRGLGHSIPLRINRPPEITLIELA